METPGAVKGGEALLSRMVPTMPTTRAQFNAAPAREVEESGLTCSGPEGPVSTVGPTSGDVTSSSGGESGSGGSPDSLASTVELTSTPSLAKAHDRLLRAERKGRPRKVKKEQPLRATFLGHVAAMRAEGLPIDAISRGLRTSNTTVMTALHMPETQLEIAKRRELAKQISAHMLPSVTSRGWALAGAAADEGDAKSFDAATRGLHALEKIGSSVSGEDRKVQVEHSGEITTSSGTALEQLKILIGVVVGVPGNPQ